MKLVLHRGRVVDPGNGIDEVKDVYIDDGVIAALTDSDQSPPAGYENAVTIDAQDLVVAPGLVDLRARLREPGQEYKATLQSEIEAAAASGITTLCIPPDTEPAIDTPAMAQMIRQRAEQIGKTRVMPIGALTRGLQGAHLTDMAALKAAGCAGVSNGLAQVQDTLVMRRAMQYASTFDLTVFLHAQDSWLQGNGCVHEGEISTRLGLPAIPEAAETVGVSRDLALMETTGARCHFNGLSTARAVEMVSRSLREGMPVSADVTAHHLVLTEHDIGFFNSQCHVIPPLRSPRDREHLIEGIKQGAVVAVCSDHQPHEPDAKLAPFSESEPGISGLETLLPLTLRLAHDGVVTMADALALITCSPAKILGLDAGSLAVGKHADVCVFDPEYEWTFDRESMISRGKNSPFHRWPMKGRVRCTIVEGTVVYRDNV